MSNVKSQKSKVKCQKSKVKIKRQKTNYKRQKTNIKYQCQCQFQVKSVDLVKTKKILRYLRRSCEISTTLNYNQSVQIRLAHRLYTDVQYFLNIDGQVDE